MAAELCRWLRWCSPGGTVFSDSVSDGMMLRLASCPAEEKTSAIPDVVAFCAAVTTLSSWRAISAAG